MGTFWKHVLDQTLWIVSVTAQLIASMGYGATWMIMTVRCITFAMMDLFYFLPHVFWYLLSPNIIRRVSYRSSRRTKVRNLEAIVERREQLWARESFSMGATNERKTPSLARRSSFEPSDRDGETDRFAESLRDRDTVEELAATINPADGSVFTGFPADLKDNIAHALADGSAPPTGNSFDTVVGALQKVLQRRHEQQQGQSGTRGGGAAAAAETRKSVSPDPVEDDSFTESDDEDEEDKRNLHNRATLDIYLPVPLDTLFRFLDQEKKNDGPLGDSIPERAPRGGRTQTSLRRKKFPVIICVNGGAWIVGCYFWNFLVARIFSARGYVVFCPDYRNFPQTTMEGMTLDVSDAIAWVLNNAERYNGDLNDVTLMGQSAGAHLTMMSLLSQAHLCAYDAVKGRPQDEQNTAGLRPPSAVAYNVRRYNPRKSIRCYVGLSGIYNVRGLVKHFDRRGLYRNVLQQIAGGKANMPRYSLPSYFDEHLRAGTGETIPDEVFDYLPRQMSFLHGDADVSAPVTESANLAFTMRYAQREYLVRTYQNNPEHAKTMPEPTRIEYILVPGATHTDSIIEEPLSCHNSHVVEFMTLYQGADAERQAQKHARATGASPLTVSTGSAFPAHQRCTSLQLASAPMQYTGAAFVSPNSPTSLEGPNPGSNLMNEQDEDAAVIADVANPVVPAKRPDGILLSPKPAAKRPWLMRCASYISPF